MNIDRIHNMVVDHRRRCMRLAFVIMFNIFACMLVPPLGLTTSDPEPTATTTFPSMQIAGHYCFKALSQLALLIALPPVSVLLAAQQASQADLAWSRRAEKFSMSCLKIAIVFNNVSNFCFAIVWLSLSKGAPRINALSGTMVLEVFWVRLTFVMADRICDRLFIG